MKKKFKNYTVSEKRAYWIGVGAGIEHRGDGRKVKKLRINSRKIKDDKAKQSFLRGFLSGRKGRGIGAINHKFVKKNTSKKKLLPGAYNSRGRINDGLVDDRHGPVVFW